MITNLGNWTSKPSSRNLYNPTTGIIKKNGMWIGFGRSRLVLTFAVLSVLQPCYIISVDSSSKERQSQQLQQQRQSATSTTTTSTTTGSVPSRPTLVMDALAKKRDLYYFGLGSNMLRSKLESRAVCGTTILIKSMVPAYVKYHRLAFNMRGFLPLEPSMGSLEPIIDTKEEEEEQITYNQDKTNQKNDVTQKISSVPLVAYQKNECHGALVKLSSQDYERVMRSEGIPSTSRQGYEEVVVEAYPYQKGKLFSSRRPVPAIALRARNHVRLTKDAAPSQRYMTLLQQGAKELGVIPSYQQFLHCHPVAESWSLAVLNLVFLSKVSSQFKIRSLFSIQSWCLWKVYIPPTETSNLLLQTLSELATILILLPGAIPGFFLFWYMKRTNSLSPMMKIMVDQHWSPHNHNNHTTT